MSYECVIKLTDEYWKRTFKPCYFYPSQTVFFDEFKRTRPETYNLDHIDPVEDVGDVYKKDGFLCVKTVHDVYRYPLEDVIEYELKELEDE